MKVDMHLHTCYSEDATLSLEAIVEACQHRGLDGVAVTDHNTITGALALQEIAPFLVIVGEEIETMRGEILGFFLREEIQEGLKPEEAIGRIREQGGLVGVSHPLDRVRRSAMGQKALLDILDEIDFLEGFNSRVIFPSDNRKAQRLAQARGLPMTAGSDAHTAYEIGRAYVEMPPFNGPEDFLESLAQGRIVGHLTPSWIHILTTWTRLRAKFG